MLIGLVTLQLYTPGFEPSQIRSLGAFKVTHHKFHNFFRYRPKFGAGGFRKNGASQ